jgi:cytochrome c peroxidase
VKADPTYVSAFRAATGGEPTIVRVAAALAAYERTIYSVDAPFDRFMAGDAQALSPAAQRGLGLFGTKAHCGECHAGSNFTDELFHNLGLSGDPGRSAVTENARDQGAFKTPTLREVALTAPYMHDGSKATLLEVVEFYDQGATPHPNLDARIRKLGLTLEERQDLVTFMEALSGRIVEGVPPDSAPDKERR